MPEDEITEYWEFISPVTQEAIIRHPTGRTIQSITIISFDPLAAACLCHQSNKFNLYHTLIEGITNRKWLSKNLWWNVITQNESQRWPKICFPIQLAPGLARSQKAFHTLIKSSKEESINRGGKSSHAHAVFSDRLSGGQTSNWNSALSWIQWRNINQRRDRVPEGVSRLWMENGGRLEILRRLFPHFFPPLSESEKMRLPCWMTEIPVFAKHACC